MPILNECAPRPGPIGAWPGGQYLTPKSIYLPVRGVGSDHDSAESGVFRGPAPLPRILHLDTSIPWDVRSSRVNTIGTCPGAFQIKKGFSMRNLLRLLLVALGLMPMGTIAPAQTESVLYNFNANGLD